MNILDSSQNQVEKYEISKNKMELRIRYFGGKKGGYIEKNADDTLI